MRLKTLTIVPRRDTIENWNKINPIPKDKELCAVLTKFNKCKYKVGDGKTPFKKLKYVKKINDINEILCYSILPVNDDDMNNCMKLVSHVILDPFHNTQYRTHSQDKDPYDFNIIENTKIYEEKINDTNESSEELPMQPLEK